MFLKQYSLIIYQPYPKSFTYNIFQIDRGDISLQLKTDILEQVGTRIEKNNFFVFGRILSFNKIEIYELWKIFFN